MSKIVFVTHCQNELINNFGGYKLLNSFKYFHPDVDIFHLGTKEMNEIYTSNPWSCLHSFMPLTMKYVQDITNTDFVCHLDWDSIVLSRLDEILNCYYDIASVRNNNDNFLNNESHNRPYPIQNIANHLYCNAGCVSANKNFIDEWIKLNKEATEKFGSIYKAYVLVEQDTMNILAYSGKFKFEILDPLGGNYYYGCSANIHSPNIHEIPATIKRDYGISNWSSWLDIEYKENKFFLYDKQIKILHQAGGGDAKTCEKLSWDMFNPNIIDKLKEITC